MDVNSSKSNPDDNIDNQLKLILATTMPDNAHAWIDGYIAANHGTDLDHNPHSINNPEYCSWVDGWWEGFYNADLLALKDKNNTKFNKDSLFGYGSKSNNPNNSSNPSASSPSHNNNRLLAEMADLADVSIISNIHLVAILFITTIVIISLSYLVSIVMS